MSRQLILNAFVMDYGHHEAAWRASQADAASSVDVAHYVAIAQRAEAGKLDAVFFADIPAVASDVRRRAADFLDPILLHTAIATQTRNIGLIATASTTYTEPYNLARSFATLDHISGGRAGWNMVTTQSPAAAANYGRAEHPDPEQRYARGREYLEVVNKLWDSWEDDAVVGDKARGFFADPAKVHAIEHVGEHYRVGGALNVRRSPQGRPVQVQAGSSDAGIDIAGRYAEAVFTAQRDLASGVTFAERVRDAAQGYGRGRDAVKILPGIVPVIRDTEAQAKQALEDLDDLIVPEYAVLTLAETLGLDPADLDLDAPLPWDLIGDPKKFSGKAARADLIITIALDGNLTVRQILRRLGGGRGHNILAGTAEQLAGYITDWFTAGAADGFNVMPPVYETEFGNFLDWVVPILQERGLFRAEYTGTTLRENYGLDRPASQYAADPALLS